MANEGGENRSDNATDNATAIEDLIDSSSVVQNTNVTGTGNSGLDVNEGPPTEISTGTTRTHSALHNRLLNQQRSNILLQVLFHHMLNSRRRREEEDHYEPPPLPDREMPVLTHEQALNINAICRFCFDGSYAEEIVDEAENEQDHSRRQMNDNSNEGMGTSSRRSINSSSRSRRKPPNLLVAPCNCDGGSRWVHLECLRQWQRMQARSPSGRDLGELPDTTTAYREAGYVCNVCNSPYLSRPPVARALRENLLKRGTLLVSKPNAIGRTFQQSVILLLTDVCSNSHGAFGLIINAPFQDDLTPPQNLLIENENRTDDAPETEPVEDMGNRQNTPTTDTTEIEFRRGGPVCGGRLGVVHYTILHTFPPRAVGEDLQHNILDVDIDEEYIDEHDTMEEYVVDDVDDTDGGAILTGVYGSNLEELAGGANILREDIEMGLRDPLNFIDEHDAVDENLTGGIDDHNNVDDENDDSVCAPTSLQIFDDDLGSAPLQFIAAPDSSVPSTFSEDSISRAVKNLVRSHCRDMEDGNADAGATEDSHESSTNHVSSSGGKVIIFSGYCKWRAGQLEREIQREVWGVCVDASSADILRHHSSNFWEELSESDRLLSWQGLVEGGEDEELANE